MPAELRPQLDAYLRQAAEVAVADRQHSPARYAATVASRPSLDRKWAPTIAANEFVAQIEDPAEKAKARELISELGTGGGQQAYIDDVKTRNAAMAAASAPHARPRRRRRSAGRRGHGVSRDTGRATPGPEAAAPAFDYSVGEEEFGVRANTVRGADTITVYDSDAPPSASHDTPAAPADTGFDSTTDDLAADFGVGDDYATTERVTQDFPTSTAAAGTLIVPPRGDERGEARPRSSRAHPSDRRRHRAAHAGRHAACEASAAAQLIVPPRGDERGEGASGIVAVTGQPTPAATQPASFGSGTAEDDTTVLTPGQERVAAFRNAVSAHEGGDPNTTVYREAVRHFQNPEGWKDDPRGREMYEATLKSLQESNANASGGYFAADPDQLVKKAEEQTEQAWKDSWENIADSPQLAGERLQSQDARVDQLMRRWKESGEWPLKTVSPEGASFDTWNMKLAVQKEVAASEGGPPTSFEDLDLSDVSAERGKELLEAGKFGEVGKFLAGPLGKAGRAAEFAAGVPLGAISALAMAPDYRYQQDTGQMHSILQGQGGEFQTQSFGAYLGSHAYPRQYTAGDVAQELVPGVDRIDALADYQAVGSPITKGIMLIDAAGVPLPTRTYAVGGHESRQEHRLPQVASIESHYAGSGARRLHRHDEREGSGPDVPHPA